MKRRAFIKWATAFPLLAQVGWQQAMGTGWAEVARNSTDNIYTRLGVKPLINARGTWTYLSASLELPEVRAAQVEAAQHFVNIFDLQIAAGRRLAQLTGAESGMITSGAAGAMAVATAGCIAGTDPDKVWQLPNTDGLRNEVIMVGGRSVFDSAIRLAGGKFGETVYPARGRPVRRAGVKDLRCVAAEAGGQRGRLAGGVVGQAEDDQVHLGHDVAPGGGVAAVFEGQAFQGDVRQSGQTLADAQAGGAGLAVDEHCGHAISFLGGERRGAAAEKQEAVWLDRWMAGNYLAPLRLTRDLRVMRVRNSLRSAKVRDKNCRVVRRRGRVYVINKKNPRMKCRQG